MDGVTAISTIRVKTLYPGIRPLAYRVLEDVCRLSGKRMNIASARRNAREQLEAWSKGRELVNGVWRIADESAIVTNAFPGYSWHEYGLAFDCSWVGEDPWLTSESEPVKTDLWALYAKSGRAHGFQSITLKNGKPDLPHLQFTYGMTLVQAQELFAYGGLASVWTHLDGIRGVEKEWVLTEVS